MEILFYLLFIGKLQSYISLKSNRQKCSLNSVFLKISRNSLENTCVGVSFIIMLRTVAFAPYREYKKGKILMHIPAFLSSNLFLFSFLSQSSDFPFKIFILCLHCYVTLFLFHAHSICFQYNGLFKKTLGLRTLNFQE